MTANRTTVAVAVAAVAGAAVAGVGLATRGSGHQAAQITIDELHGRIGQAVLGESRSGVVAVLGQPEATSTQDTLRYQHLRIGMHNGLVVSIRTDDDAARTLRAVAVGDPLGAVRATYRKASACVKLPEKETESSTDSSAGYCTVRVPAGRLLFNRNPIASITLSRS